MTYPFNPVPEKLAKRDDNAALGIGALGVRIHAGVIAQRDMHQTALVRAHGRQRDGGMLTHGTGGSVVGHRDHLVVTAALVALDVHGNGIAEPELTADQQREEGLKRLQCLAVTTDEHRQIGRGDVEDKLPLVPVILIDRRILGVEVEQKVAKNGDGEVSDGVEILVRELLPPL